MWLYIPLSEDSHCAPESVHSNSASTSPSETDTALYVSSSGTPTPQPASWPGWKRRPWRRRLSGATLERSTAALGVALWKLSALGSLANPGPVQDGDGASPTTGGFGPTSAAWFARYDPASCSWRTCQNSLLEEGLALFSAIWPKAGSMRNGECSGRPTLAPRTAESDSSSWPTATAGEAKGRAYQRDGGSKDGYARPSLTGQTQMWPTPNVPNGGRMMTEEDVANKGATERGKRQVDLGSVARFWPTPVAHDDQKSPEAHMAMKARMPGGPRSTVMSLTVAVKLWPTPKTPTGGPESRASRASRGSGGEDLAAAVLSRPDLATGPDGQTSSPPTRALNPRFVEMLMGWPTGWTDCEQSETESYRSWQQQHSSALRNVLASWDNR